MLAIYTHSRLNIQTTTSNNKNSSSTSEVHNFTQTATKISCNGRHDYAVVFDPHAVAWCFWAGQSVIIKAAEEASEERGNWGRRL